MPVVWPTRCRHHRRADKRTAVTVAAHVRRRRRGGRESLPPRRPACDVTWCSDRAATVITMLAFVSHGRRRFGGSGSATAVDVKIKTSSVLQREFAGAAETVWRRRWLEYTATTAWRSRIMQRPVATQLRENGVRAVARQRVLPDKF